MQTIRVLSSVCILNIQSWPTRENKRLESLFLLRNTSFRFTVGLLLGLLVRKLYKVFVDLLAVFVLPWVTWVTSNHFHLISVWVFFPIASIYVNCFRHVILGSNLAALASWPNHAPCSTPPHLWYRALDTAMHVETNEPWHRQMEMPQTKWNLYSNSIYTPKNNKNKLEF